MKLSASSSNIVIQQVTEGEKLTNTLTLLRAARSDAGEYICSVTSQLTNATANATLTVFCELFVLMLSYLFTCMILALQLLLQSMNGHKARPLFRDLLPHSLAQLMVSLDQSSHG